MTATYLALGDSYTIGEAVEEAERWPVQLAVALTRTGQPVEPPRIIATTGWTVDELSAGIDTAQPTGTWDLVSLLVGVNDQYRGYGVDRYERAFHEILTRSLGFAKLAGRLIVLSIPDWGVTPFAAGKDQAAIGREIDSFNAVARRLAEGAGARFVDITPLSRLAATDRALLASDGLHPSGAMYRQWTERVLPVAQAALATR